MSKPFNIPDSGRPRPQVRTTGAWKSENKIGGGKHHIPPSSKLEHTEIKHPSRVSAKVLLPLLFVLDWKAGAFTASSAQRAESQLGVYALYCRQRFRVPWDSIHVQAVYLGLDGTWMPRQVSRAATQTLAHRIQREIGEEIERLELVPHPSGRIEVRADQERFPPAPTANGCALCPFREICPEGQAICAKISLSASSPTDHASRDRGLDRQSYDAPPPEEKLT